MSTANDLFYLADVDWRIYQSIMIGANYSDEKIAEVAKDYREMLIEMFGDKNRSYINLCVPEGLTEYERNLWLREKMPEIPI